MARRKWRVIRPGGGDENTFPSERWAYDFVDILRRNWAEGQPHSTGALTVQVDEGLGHGWETFEHIDFAEEGR